MEFKDSLIDKDVIFKLPLAPKIRSKLSSIGPLTKTARNSIDVHQVKRIKKNSKMSYSDWKQPRSYSQGDLPKQSLPSPSTLRRPPVPPIPRIKLENLEKKQKSSSRCNTAKILTNARISQSQRKLTVSSQMKIEGFRNMKSKYSTESESKISRYKRSVSEKLLKQKKQLQRMRTNNYFEEI